MSSDFSMRKGAWQRPLSTILKDGDLFTGRYLIIRTAAFGGMSRIYEARDETTGESVALKVLSLPNVDDLFRQRFEREIHILGQLKHENLVRSHDSGRTEDGALFLCLEWLEGMDLGDHIKQGQTEIVRALEIMRGTLRGLQVVHDAGVVHRDLKPANIFVKSDAEPPQGVKLLDFGVAKLVDEQMVGSFQSTLTTAGMVVGTPYYMAPEQAQGIEEIDFRADLFSIGSALFELICGEKPFNASSALALLVRIATEEAPPIRDLMPDAPVALDEFLRKALQRRPEDRFQTASEMEAAMGQLISDLAEDATPTLYDTDALAEVQLQLNQLQGVPTRTASGTDLGGLTLRTGGSPPGVGAPPPGIPASLDHTLPERKVELPDVRKVGVLVADFAPLGDARDEASLFFNEDVGAEGGATISLRGGVAVGTFDDDDGERAMRAGIRVIQILGRLTTVQTIDSDLRVAVGSGHTAADADARIDGDAIEAACGLLAYAEPGEIVVDADTAKRTDDMITTRPRAQGVHVVVNMMSGGAGLSDQPSKNVGTDVPMVGRQMELQDLLIAYAACADERKPACVLLTGAPGVGKTRLKEALRTQIEMHHPEATTLYGRGDVDGRSVPFSVLTDALRRRGAVRGGEGSDTIFDKLDRLVPESVSDEHRDGVRIELARLMGTAMPSEEIGATHVEVTKSTGARRSLALHVRDTLLEVIRGFAAEGPLVLILDDMQWSDPASLGVVLELLRGNDTAILIVLTARPGIGSAHANALAALRATDRLTATGLPPLQLDAVGELATALCPLPFDDATRRALMERTAGNPRHIEQVTMAIGLQASDDGATEHDVSLPNRLAALPQGLPELIQLRMHTLPADAQELLQYASIFGGCFWDQGVVALGFDNPKPVLEELIERGFLTQRDMSRYAGTREFQFKNDHMREIAYSALPEVQRKAFHEVAASWLEASGEADPLSLARHYQPAGLVPHAVHALLQCARRSLVNSDAMGAIALATEGLEVADETTTSDDRLALLDVEQEALELLGRYQDALTNLAAIGAEIPPGAPDQWKTNARSAELMLLSGDSAGSLRAYKDALAAEEQRGAEQPAAWLALGVGDALRARGDTLNACVQYQRTYAAGKQFKDPDMLAQAILRLGRIAYATADINQAGRLFDDAYRRFGEVGDRRNQGEALLGAGATACMAGDRARALQSLTEAMATFEVVQDRRRLLETRAYVGRTRYEAGETIRALAELQTVSLEVQTAEFRQPQLVAGLFMLQTMLDTKRNQEAADLAQTLFDAAVRYYPRFIVPVESGLGLAICRLGDIPTGLRHAEAAVARLETQKASEDEDPQRIYAQYAQALELTGDLDRARMNWVQAATTMTEVEARIPQAQRAAFRARPINHHILRAAGTPTPPAQI